MNHVSYDSVLLTNLLPVSLTLSHRRERIKGIEYGHEFRPKICEQNGVRRPIMLWNSLLTTETVALSISSLTVKKYRENDFVHGNAPCSMSD